MLRISSGELAGCVAVVMAMVAAPTEVSAADWTITDEHEPSTRRHQLDLGVQAYVGPRFGFVPGVVYGLPVAPQGFISSLNDAFFVEVAIFPGVFFDPTFFWLTPAAGVRWSFYLTREWAAFAALRAGWSFGFHDEAVVDGFYIDGTIGAHWHFSRDLALRLETGGARFGYRAFVALSWQLPVEF